MLVQRTEFPIVMASVIAKQLCAENRLRARLNTATMRTEGFSADLSALTIV